MQESTRGDILNIEAVEWFLKLQEGAQSTDSAQFSEWLTRSPNNIEEYLAVSLAWSALQVPAGGKFSAEALIAAARAHPETDNVVTLPTVAARPNRDQQPARRWWRAAAAAALVAIVAGGWVAYRSWFAAETYRTGLHEQRSVVLADGSVVEMNPNSQIDLHWTVGERRLDLRHGRARFQVAKNPNRPFVVVTTYSAVQAVGTVFDVEANPSNTQISVIEGRVAVKTPRPLLHSDEQGGAREGAGTGDADLQLSAGDHATVASIVAAGGDAAAPSIVAWTAQRVVFRSAPLASVIDEFNRYRTRPLVLQNEGLALLTISGVFDPKNPDSLLRYLELYEGVRVESAPDGSLHLSLSHPPQT